MGNHFKIIVPFYNVEKWVKACIRSVKAQDYKDFQCILLDDMSTDNTAEIVRKEIGDDPRFTFVEVQEKAFALKNIYDGIALSNPSPEDVIVTLDGDDWLSRRDVLTVLDLIYRNSDCRMTYGSYAEYPGGKKGKFAKQIPAEWISQRVLRKAPWQASHLRTFKHDLWKRIKLEDLQDTDGKFYRMAWDLAFMFPMLEMAGTKSVHIGDPLYVYNMSNPLNDHKLDNELQVKTENEIRAKQPYETIPANEGQYPSTCIVSHSNRFVYTFIPKVACSSLKMALSKQFGVDVNISDAAKENVFNDLSSFEAMHAANWPILPKHLNFHDQLWDYLKFAIVRNPWDRLVSCYKNKILSTNDTNEFYEGGVHRALVRDYGDLFYSGMDFTAFAEAVCGIPDALAEDHFRSQHTFITHRGQVFTNRIGKLEDIEQEWTYLCANMNIDNELQNINVSSNSGTKRTYKEYYSDELRDKVAQRYQKDIEMFGYDF
jgi:glycosyltransferase involved in cell wall biosynthesis|tara:strand:- start:931 stop:2388 length:1458 start_codon:yes stop_codon:yes gene_type:complete